MTSNDVKCRCNGFLINLTSNLLTSIYFLFLFGMELDAILTTVPFLCAKMEVEIMKAITKMRARHAHRKLRQSGIHVHYAGNSGAQVRNKQ